MNKQTRKALELARNALALRAPGPIRNRAIAAIDAALSAPAAPVAQTVIELTDDMLRYAMAALGTGSPKEAQKFRLFWHFATEAMSSAPAAPVAQPLTDEVVQALLEALRECLTCEFPVTDKAAICKAEAAIAKAAGWRT